MIQSAIKMIQSAIKIIQSAIKIYCSMNAFFRFDAFSM
jgi:hypothetical protein